MLCHFVSSSRPVILLIFDLFFHFRGTVPRTSSVCINPNHYVHEKLKDKISDQHQCQIRLRAGMISRCFSNHSAKWLSLPPSSKKCTKFMDKLTILIYLIYQIVLSNANLKVEFKAY